MLPSLLTVLAAVLTVPTVYASSPYDLVPPLPLDAALNYDFGGSTSLSRNEVRLTLDNAGEHGYIVSNHEGLLPTNFELEIKFKIEGSGRNLYGDGMALFFLEEMVGPGRLMGLSEFYKGASLVVDSYRNGKGGRAFPRLLLMKNDGTEEYDLHNDGLRNELDGCSMRGLHNNKRLDAAVLRIAYSQPLKRFVVSMNYRDRWESCISAELDMGPVSKLAFSAATGELTDSHIIKLVKLTDFNDQIPGLITSMSRQSVAKEKHDREVIEERAGFFSRIGRGILFLFKIAFGCVAVGIALFAATILFKKAKKLRNREDEYKLI